MPAPIATTSSGFTPLCGSLPMRLRAISTTFGIRVMPPTSTSSLMSLSLRFASFRHAFTGGMVRWNKSSQSCSNFERVSFFWMCFGPLASAVMNGRLISYSCVDESAIFCFLGLFLDALDRIRLLRQIDAGVFLKFIDDPIHDSRIPVIAAQMRVAVGRFDFENAIADFENGNVERAATQIVNRNLFVLLLVETVGERRGCWLVDDPQYFQTGNLACVFGRVSLRVVEIRRYGDHRLRNFFAELGFGVGFHLRQNHRGNFRRRKCLALAVHFNLHMRVAIRRFDNFIWNAVLFLVDLVKLAA